MGCELREHLFYEDLSRDKTLQLLPGERQQYYANDSHRIEVRVSEDDSVIVAQQEKRGGSWVDTWILADNGKGFVLPNKNGFVKIRVSSPEASELLA